MVVPLLPGPPGFRDRPVCGIGTGPASGLQNGDPHCGQTALAWRRQPEGAEA